MKLVFFNLKGLMFVIAATLFILLGHATVTALTGRR